MPKFGSESDDLIIWSLDTTAGPSNRDEGRKSTDGKFTTFDYMRGKFQLRQSPHRSTLSPAPVVDLSGGDEELAPTHRAWGVINADDIYKYTAKETVDDESLKATEELRGTVADAELEEAVKQSVRRKLFFNLVDKINVRTFTQKDFDSYAPWIQEVAVTQGEGSTG